MNYAFETNRKEVKQYCAHDDLPLVALLYENEVAVYEFDKSSSNIGEGHLKGIWLSKSG